METTRDTIQNSRENTYFDDISLEQRLFIGEARLAATNNFIHRFSQYHEGLNPEYQNSNSSFEHENFSGPEAENIKTIDESIEHLRNPGPELRKRIYGFHTKLARHIHSFVDNNGQTIKYEFYCGIPVLCYTEEVENKKSIKVIQKEFFTREKLYQALGIAGTEWNGILSLYPSEELTEKLTQELLSKENNNTVHIKSILKSEKFKDKLSNIERQKIICQSKYEKILGAVLEAKHNQTDLQIYRTLGIPFEPDDLKKYFGIGSCFTLDNQKIYALSFQNRNSFPVVLHCSASVDSLNFPTFTMKAMWDLNTEEEVLLEQKQKVLLTSITFFLQDSVIDKTMIESMMSSYGLVLEETNTHQASLEKYIQERERLSGITNEHTQKVKDELEMMKRSVDGVRICKTITFPEPITLYS